MTQTITQHDQQPLRTQQVPTDRLRPWPGNPRIMPAEEMRKLCRSIEAFGLVQPIVVRRADNVVVGGHQRLDAARALGLTKVPVVYVDVTEAEAKTLNLALNRISGEWDLPRLGALLDELRDLPDLDMTLTGFDAKEMDDLLAEYERSQRIVGEERFDAEAAMLEAQQATGPTRVQPGEVWQLGRHRMACGDATDPSSWERLMTGRQAQAVVTDPPYAINYIGGRAAQVERIGRARRGAAQQQPDTYWDQLSPSAYSHLLVASLTLAHRHSDAKAPLYLWFASAHLRRVLTCLTDAGWEERYLLIWAKNIGAGALFAQYHHLYEPFFYAHKQGQSPRWHGPSNEVTIWSHDKPVRNELHPTMKPLPLIERAVSNATAPRQLVVDPFLGSGTAIIAAQRTGRVCYGMDLEPRYCDVILRRWEESSGRPASKLADADGMDLPAGDR
jgi:DNA modification methylase